MWMDAFFADRIEYGCLQLRFVDGATRSYGSGAPAVVWELESPRVLRRILADPAFMLGQTYLDGQWRVRGGSLIELLQLLMRNFPETNGAGRIWRCAALLLRPLHQWNRRAASRRNVSHHYDLDESLFRGFLDPDMHYSCAYFEHAEQSLEQAQQAKCGHIRRKLLLAPGHRVLDIGCGWGGLAMHLAEHGADVVGVTLSQEQYHVARERVRARGLQRKVDIRLCDYRDVSESFDRVVSVGMFEHVGVPQYGVYFGAVRERLHEDGVALIHTIGRSGPPTVTNPWIRRYIFPGGYIPALSEATAAIERAGVVCADVEVLREHYGHTLLAWLERFDAIRAQVAAVRGERFCRLWEYYLAACAACFFWRDLVVFQLQLARRPGSVPLTRDYLYGAAEYGVEPAKCALHHSA